MDTTVVAAIIQEGSKLLSAIIKSRPYHPEIHQEFTESISQKIPDGIEPPAPAETGAISSAKATAVPTGCIPCAMGHFGTCSGLLNEGMRFALKDGMSGEVVDRINMCLDELNTMERVDLRPEMVSALGGWEKDLADRALKASRDTRHQLEAIKSPAELEKLAAETQSRRREIGREYFQKKYSELSPEAQQAIQKSLAERKKQQEASSESSG